ncbi:MAG TPA: signal peptidase II [Mycobacterium sp.]|nr:signal peptidase II [Mycobacterium sp.]
MRVVPLVAQFATAATVFAVDLLTKALAVSLIPADRTISVLGDNVTLAVERNAGAALSIGEDYTWVFTGIVVAVIGVLSWCGRRSDSRFMAVGIGLVLGVRWETSVSACSVLLRRCRAMWWTSWQSGSGPSSTSPTSVSLVA